MNEVGFLYVLANSAMPGMVKVGKTTRTPAERAVELSTATGVPTPFIVVYEQLFEDCTAAEEFVHAVLARNGFRIAANREFFNAPVNDVIKAITQTPGAISGTLPEDAAHENADGGLSSGLDLYFEAETHYFGDGDYLQDFTEALALYTQAARLGCNFAYLRLGQIYEEGNGVAQNKTRAVEFYKEGARKGVLFCHWKLGALFLREPNGYPNAMKCFRVFIRDFDTDPISSSETEIYSNYRGDLAASCADIYLISKRFGKYALPPDILEFFTARANSIAWIADIRAKEYAQEGERDLANHYQFVVNAFTTGSSL